MVNECFGVGVMSVAMDGAAPELNPGWVRRRINTYPEVRHTQESLAKQRADMCTCRTALMLLFPQLVILAKFERYAILGYACRCISAVLVEQ